MSSFISPSYISVDNLKDKRKKKKKTLLFEVPIHLFSFTMYVYKVADSQNLVSAETVLVARDASSERNTTSFKITKDSAVQWFQTRINHEILATNTFLCKIKLTNDKVYFAP